jgi:hypothetical protein
MGVDGSVDWGQLPVWLLAIVVILKVVFDFLEKWSAKKAKSDDDGRSPEEVKLRVVLAKLDVFEKQLSDLHQWHSVRDGAGQFLWYPSRSAERAIESLADVLSDMKQALVAVHSETKAQTEILKKIVENQHRQDERLTRLSADIPRLRAHSGAPV